MKKLSECMTKPATMWCFAGLGVAFIIVGIVTAAINRTFAAFTPMLWFLLAIFCGVGKIWVVAMRILARLESKTQS